MYKLSLKKVFVQIKDKMYQGGIRPIKGQSILARQLRLQVIQKWVSQNKNKGCSQWNRQLQRLNKFYQTIANQILTPQQKIMEIMSSFNYRLGKVSLQLNSLQGNNNIFDPKCLYHPSCLSPFIVQDITKYLYLTAQVLGQDQAEFREQGIRRCSQEDGWKNYLETYQARKHSRQIKVQGNQPTKILVDNDLSFQIPSLPKVKQNNNLTFQFDFIDSVKRKQLLPFYPPLISQGDHSLISLSMGCVKLKDQNNCNVEIKQPIIVKTKAPLNMSKKQAQQFKRFIYSYGDQRWNAVEGGLTYDDNLKEFSMQMQTADSLGKEYIFQEVEKIAKNYSQKVQNIISVIQTNLVLPSYKPLSCNKQQLLNMLKRFQYENKANEKIRGQDNIFFELSKVSGKPTYLTQRLRHFCKQTDGFRKQQIEVNLKNQIVKRLCIKNLQFHLCNAADIIAEALGIELTEDERILWDQLISIHNNDVIQEVSRQKELNQIQVKQLYSKIKDKSIVNGANHLEQTQGMLQEKKITKSSLENIQNAEKQNLSKIQVIIKQLISFPQKPLKVSFDDQFIFKRVYIYEGRYQNILLSFLLRNLAEERKKMILISLDQRKLLKKSLKSGSELFDYKKYYNTYPNIFQFPEAQFEINPFIPKQQLDKFRQKLKKMKNSQQQKKQILQRQNFQLLQLQDQYKSTKQKFESLLTQKEINSLLLYKQQKIQILRKTIASIMKNKLKEHQDVSYSQKQFNYPRGYLYSLKKLQEISSCFKESYKISDEIMRGYRQSGLHSIFAYEDPHSLRSLANDIQKNVRSKLITIQQFLGCQLIMNQASGIDAFKGIDEIDIIISQGLEYNKNIIDEYCSRVQNFLKSQKFLNQKDDIQNSFENYTVVQLNVNASLAKMRQIKSRVAAQFNYIANLTTYVYVNNDRLDYYRKLTRPEMSSKIYDYLARFFVDIRKPKFPGFKHKELKKQSYKELKKEKQRLTQILQKLSQQYKSKALNSIYKIDCPKNIILVNSCTQIFEQLKIRLNYAKAQVKKHEEQQLQKKEKIQQMKFEISGIHQQMKSIQTFLIQPELDDEQKNSLQLQYIQLEQQINKLHQGIDETEKCTHTTPPQIIVLQKEILEAKEKQVETLLGSYQNKLNKLHGQVTESFNNYNKHVDRLMESRTLEESSRHRKNAIEGLKVYFEKCELYEKQLDGVEVNLEEAIKRLSLQTKQKSQRRAITLNKVKGLFKKIEALLSTPFSFDKDVQQRSTKLSQQILQDLQDFDKTDEKQIKLMYLSLFGKTEASQIMKRKSQIDNWILRQIEASVGQEELQLKRFKHQYNQLFQSKKYEYQQTILTTSQEFKHLVIKFVQDQN